MCEELQPDIVLMDIKVPGINGLEAAKTIKTKNKDIVIIFMSAYIEEQYIQKCISSGGDDFIPKPSRPDEIARVINKYIDKLKKKDNPIIDMKKELVGFISVKDYKASKKVLGYLIDRIQLIHAKDIKELKLSCRDIAVEIIKSLEFIELKDKSKNLNDEEILREILSINDSYSIKSWLFKVLDAVFERIIDNKGISENDELKLVLNYIEKNYFKKITLEEVAEYINFSPFYLSKLFKKEIGINFIDYVTELKMEKARDLLANTDIPIINISLELSYNGPNYFSRVFKKSSGVTPSQYRDTKLKEKSIPNEKNLISKNVTIANAKWYV
jgi:two-component system response regulator YesN